MIKANFDFISEDFRYSKHLFTSDSTYLLRMMLFRAGSEAGRRYYLSNGEKAKEYRRIAYELDELAGDIERYLDDTGRIKPQFIAIIFEAITLARYLILLDQRETGVRYEAIVENLFYPRKDGWPDAMAA